MAAQHTLSSLGVRSGLHGPTVSQPCISSNPTAQWFQHTAYTVSRSHNTLDPNGSPHDTTPPHCTPLSQHAAITIILCPDKVSLDRVSYTSPTPAERDPNLPIIPQAKPQPHVQTPPNIPPIQTGACPPFASSTTISSPINSRLRVLFTFPSQYLFAIGLSLLFSLRCSLPPTLCCTPKQHDSLGATPNSHATQI